MTTRGFVSLVMTSAILAAALPAAAADGTSGPTLRASIDRALAAPAPPMSLHSKASRGTRRSQSGTNTGSGGGGGGHMVLALLGTAISVGATIFLVKEMQKNRETVPVPPPSFR